MPSAAACNADRTAGSSASKAASQLPSRHPQVVQAGAVEALGQVTDRPVAAGADLGEDRRDRRDRLGAGRLGAREADPLGRVAEVTPAQVQPVQHNGTVPGAPVDPEAANGNGDACDTRLMTTSRAELGSALTQLRELADRVSRAGDDLNQSPTEDAAAALYEADRALRTALRSVERAVGLL